MKIQFSIKMNVGSSGAIVTIILSQYFYSSFMYFRYLHIIKWHRIYHEIMNNHISYGWKV